MQVDACVSLNVSLLVCGRDESNEYMGHLRGARSSCARVPAKEQEMELPLSYFSWSSSEDTN